MNLHEKVRSAYKIGVFGSDGDHCSERASALAYETGRLIAERNAIIFTGGRSGVMEYSSKGAAEYGGLVIGILPTDNRQDANLYCSLVIPTGIGFARDQITTNSVDGAIVIEGGLGTHGEVGRMYWLQKPCVAIRTSGGTAERVAGKVLDNRNHAPILSADNPEEAVNLLFSKFNARNP